MWGSETSRNEACSSMGGVGVGGRVARETSVCGNNRGEGFYVPFCFCKMENSECMKEIHFIFGFLQIKMAIIMESASQPSSVLWSRCPRKIDLERCFPAHASLAGSLISITWGLVSTAKPRPWSETVASNRSISLQVMLIHIQVSEPQAEGNFLPFCSLRRQAHRNGFPHRLYCRGYG